MCKCAVGALTAVAELGSVCRVQQQPKARWSQHATRCKAAGDTPEPEHMLVCMRSRYEPHGCANTQGPLQHIISAAFYLCISPMKDVSWGWWPFGLEAFALLHILIFILQHRWVGVLQFMVKQQIPVNLRMQKNFTLSLICSHLHAEASELALAKRMYHIMCLWLLIQRNHFFLYFFFWGKWVWNNEQPYFQVLRCR